MRRALGFKLEMQGPRLMSFVRFCQDRGADRVTADLTVEWATATSGDEVNQARRLDVVRIFARHLQALDPATEVPPDDVLSRRYRRIPPYLYSPEEVSALMRAADGLAPAIRAATWRTLIGLLAVTPSRLGANAASATPPTSTSSASKPPACSSRSSTYASSWKNATRTSAPPAPPTASS